MKPVAIGLSLGRTSALELLSLCPLLVASTSLLRAALMSGLFVFVFCASAVSASACRRLIPPEAETACLLILAAAWVSVADLALQAGLYPMHAALGIYVPIMAGNCLLLVHLGEQALTNGPRVALSTALGTGVRVAVLVVAAAGLRELAATGGLLADAELLSWPASLEFSPLAFPVLGAAPGAFIALAVLVAAMNLLRPDWAE